MMEKITNYYRLCGVKKDPVIPIINLISHEALDYVFTKKYVELYFVEQPDHHYKIRENVIGAGKSPVGPVIVV